MSKHHNVISMSVLLKYMLYRGSTKYIIYTCFIITFLGHCGMFNSHCFCLLLYSEQFTCRHYNSVLICKLCPITLLLVPFLWSNVCTSLFSHRKDLEYVCLSLSLSTGNSDWVLIHRREWHSTSKSLTLYPSANCISELPSVSLPASTVSWSFFWRTTLPYSCLLPISSPK